MIKNWRADGEQLYRLIGPLLVLLIFVVTMSIGLNSAPDPPKFQPGKPSSATPAPSKRPPGRTTVDRRSGFVHPGVLVSVPQLDYVVEQIRKREEPWLSAFEAMRTSRYADLSWAPTPRAVVECGPFSQPDHGCSDEHNDAVAAYTHALMWYITYDARYAKKAIQILDAWSAVLQRHTNANAAIQAAWSGASFVRAAELIKHTYHGWEAESQARVANMFRIVFLPSVINGSVDTGGNWELIMMDAATGIAVHLDDRSSFDIAVGKWRSRLRAYIYLTSDGSIPKGPPGGAQSRDQIVAYWSGQTKFVDGLTQETCRDLPHTGWGLTAAAHVAETARIQGLDLYAEARARLTKALEFNSALSLGEPVPSWLCNGTVRGRLEPIPEIAYNHYQLRAGVKLEKTRKYVTANRPANAQFFFGWETLTHAQNPN